MRNDKWQKPPQKIVFGKGQQCSRPGNHFFESRLCPVEQTLGLAAANVGFEHQFLMQPHNQS
jgi:hypothetical protein